MPDSSKRSLPPVCKECRWIRDTSERVVKLFGPATIDLFPSR